MIKHAKVYCHKKFGGTCSSLIMLKGYILKFGNAEEVLAHQSEC